MLLKRFITLLIACSWLNFSWAYSPYSNSELDELEKEFVQQINLSDSVLRDPLAVQYINSVGKALADKSNEPPPSFFIVKSNEINAFAGPGGYIGVNTQLILASDSESELAAVMAHEMAHVRQHHLYRMFEHQKQMRIPMLASMLASIALGVLNPALGSGALMATLTGVAQDNINFTRSSEKEADRIGIDMLANAGYDPRGMAGFFKKMQMNSRYYYSANIPPILRTHPMDEERIAEAENRSMSMRISKVSSTLDYQLFKELVRTSVAANPKILLDYYPRNCRKNNTEVACQYGLVLAELHSNQFQEAKRNISPLLSQDPENLFYEIAMAKAEVGLHLYEEALSRLRALSNNHPDNYASLMAYADALMAAEKPEMAASVLLKGSRKYKRDLALCHDLARAESASHRKAYAYFTEAQCDLLQGQARAAVQQLKTAAKLANNDKMLQERIKAKIDEIKQKDLESKS